MASISDEPSAARLAPPGETYAAVVCAWPEDADAAGEAAIAEQAERLCALGVHVAFRCTERPPGALRALRPGRGRLFVGSDATLPLDWLAAELWARGVGPGLVLVVGAVPQVPALDGAARVPGGGDGVLEALAEQLARRAAWRTPWVDERPDWCVVLEGGRTVRQRVDETLLAVADGRFGTRGSLEEDGPGADPLVVAAGVYDDRDPLITLLPGPLWTGLDFAVRPPVGRRVLDLRTGVLVRESRLPDGGSLRTLRFAAIARPGAGVLRAEGPANTLRPGPCLQPPPADVECEIGVAEGWAGTRSGLGGGITAACVEREHDDGARRFVERLVGMRADPGREPAAEEAIRQARGLAGAGFDHVLAEQRERWARRWNAADVVIDGDPTVQLGVRFALFHLLASVAEAGEAALGARGLSGGAYAGHVFWDADVFALPALAAANPPAARAMVEYRLRRLPAARAIAAARGLRGARFPWESAHDGSEVTPAEVRHPSGATVPIHTREHAEHIVADVAWGALQYAQWTGDEAFLAGRGRTLLTDIARYWASRIRYDDAGSGHIDAVIGPDEYHGPVDDNAYTNVMARWSLRRAADLAARHGGAHEEAAAWRRAADALVDGYDASTGIYEQFAGFFDLEPLLIEEIASVPVAADLLLGQQRTAETQILKQPDVLMLHHLVPEEAAPGSLAANLDFYGPRTAHGSSLSPAVHAALLARAGRPDEALEPLRLACRLDLDDLTGTTASGLHIATFGGVWQALVYGFAGLRPADGTLTVDPVLPSAWNAYEIRVRFHGMPVTVRVGRDAVTVRAAGGRPTRVTYARQVYEVGESGRRFDPPDPGGTS